MAHTYLDELRIDFSKRGLPDYMEESVIRYVMEGGEIGSFLTALFSNQLSQTFARADASNSKAIPEWIRFVYNDVPGDCWGSPEKVWAWQKVGGLKGLQQGDTQ